LILIVFIIQYDIFAQDNNINDPDNVTIVQDEKVIQPNNKNILNLERIPFSIAFDLYKILNDDNEWSVLQVAATSEAKNKKYFRVGKISKNNPFFYPGTGFSRGRNEDSSEMVIAKHGHHYIFFNDENS